MIAAHSLGAAPVGGSTLARVRTSDRMIRTDDTSPHGVTQSEEGSAPAARGTDPSNLAPRSGQ